MRRMALQRRRIGQRQTARTLRESAITIVDKAAVDNKNNIHDVFEKVCRLAMR